MTSRIGIASGDAEQSNHKPRIITVDVETLRLHTAAALARWSSRIRLDTLRPLPVFLGLSAETQLPAPQAFTPPIRKLDKASAEKCRRRVQLNVEFFISNYAALAAVVAVTVSLLHPGMLFLLAACWALWTLHHFLIRHECIVAGVPLHAVLTIPQRFYVLLALTTVVVVWKCLRPTLTFILLCLLLIGTHALLRDPKHIETSAADWLDNGSGTGGTTNREALDDDDEEGGGSDESKVLVERPGRRSDAI